jgi:hypothetical protein
MFKINPPRKPNPRAAISEILSNGFAAFDADGGAIVADAGTAGANGDGGGIDDEPGGAAEDPGGGANDESGGATEEPGGGADDALGGAVEDPGGGIDDESGGAGLVAGPWAAAAGVAVSPFCPRLAVNGRFVGGRHDFSLHACAKTVPLICNVRKSTPAVNSTGATHVTLPWCSSKGRPGKATRSVVFSASFNVRNLSNCRKLGPPSISILLCTGPPGGWVME